MFTFNLVVHIALDSKGGSIKAGGKQQKPDHFLAKIILSKLFLLDLFDRNVVKLF